MASADNSPIIILAILVAFIVGVGMYFLANLAIDVGIADPFTGNHSPWELGLGAFILTAVWRLIKPELVNKLTKAIWQYRFSLYDMERMKYARNTQIVMTGALKLNHFGCEICRVSAGCTVRFCANSSGA